MSGTNSINLLNKLVNDKINDKIKGKIDHILEAISQNKYITIPELATFVGKSEPTIHRHLDRLSELKIIRRVGSRKSGYWEVLK